MKMTLAAGLFVAASAAVFAQQAPSSGSSRSQPQAAPARTQQSTPAETPKAGEQMLTGCLTSAGNMYTLTLLDSDQAPGSTVPTVSYTLAPGSNVELDAHVNKMVRVKGTEAGPGMQNSQRVVVDNSRPQPTGTSGNANDSAATAGDRPSGGSTPTVETSAKAKIVAKTLNVSEVQPASGQCPEAK